MNNLSASVLNTEDGKAKYDQAMLKILSDKQVLAWILKRFVSEYEDSHIQSSCSMIPEIELILRILHYGWNAGIEDNSGCAIFQYKRRIFVGVHEMTADLPSPEIKRRTMY